MKSIPLEGRIWLLSLSSLPDRIQSLYVLSLRTPTLHFFSKLTCKNFLFRRFRDTALFFFPFLSGLKKPCVRTFPDARLLIFFSMFLCLFLMFSLVLRMNRIFWFLQRGLSKKCQRGVLKNKSCPFAHPLCIFLANSLVKTSLSCSSGILHYFYFFLSAFFSRRCIQHQVLFRHTFDKILL